ncbi:MAG: hypothetical protein IJP59_10055 [Muribaculaceae bacterium]|nr:hypothetical protein [Muribaculaceae bacterium]
MVKETIIVAEVEEALNALRKQVEDVAGRTMRLPSDFDVVAQVVADATGERISPNTLKRLWGYLDGYRTSRRFTLNVLARYAGHRDWDDFCRNLSNTAASQIFDSHYIDSDTLRHGARLTLRWHPGRVVTIEYRGNNEWVVMDSRNAKLAVGDTFKCQGFVPGQPLVLNGVLHQGIDHPISYICGKQGGIEIEA